MEETLFSIWKRRIITIPLWFLIATILVLLSPLWLLISILYDLFFGKNWNALRTICFFTGFFIVDCTGVLRAFLLWLQKPFIPDEATYRHKNRKIQRWFAQSLISLSSWLYNVPIKTEGAELFLDKTPALVLCRHASSGDTMLPLILPPQMKKMRYVLKAELLSDPGLDVVGHRFPNIYVRRGGGDASQETQRIISLCEGLCDDSAVVIYPEGTRFTEAKRERLLKKFEGSNPKMYAITKVLKRTLSPLRRGGLALTQNMPPDSDVIFIAHRGIDTAGTIGDLIRGDTTDGLLEIKIWRVPGKEVPRDPDGSAKFLFENWLKIDAWAQGKSIEEALTLEEVMEEYPEITFNSADKPT